MNTVQTSEITIREASDADFPALVSLFLEFATYENLPHKMVNSVERMKEEKDYFNGFVAVTPDDGIAGYATFFFTYYTFTGKAMYMDDLYISPEYRGKGLGTLLINRVIDKAKETRCNKLRWQVSNWNHTAIGFYRQLGAEIDEVERNCNLDLL
ncbi:MAG: GNAT family N-acetyltransferase [Janthinobacterium sp.]|jgi:GNAT superfamily N-acetyltransferase